MMNRNKNSFTLLKNVVWNGILSLSQILFPLITFPYITRTLGVDANGANSFASSVASYFLLFSSVGIPTYGVKACSQVREDKEKLSKTVHELVFINSLVSVFVIAIYVASTLFVPQFQNYRALLFAYGVEIVLNVIGINWMYQGIEKYRYITTRSIAFKLASIVLMFLFVRRPEDVVKYALISVFASYGGNVVNAIYSRKYVILTPISDLDIKKHIRPILFLFSTNLAVSIYSHMDSVMLGLIVGDYATGIYSVAVKVKTVLITLISSFSVVLLSRLAKVQNDGNSELIVLLKKSYSVIVMISIPVVLFFVVFSMDSVILLSGVEYADASIPMKFLMPTVFISAVSQILGNQYSVAVGKEKNLMIAVIFGAFVNLIANSLLIPICSYNGAAIGTLLAELAQCLVQMLLAKDIVREVFSFTDFIKASGAGLISSLIAYDVLMHCIHFGTFLRLLIAAAIFFPIYLLFLYLFKYGLVKDILMSFSNNKLKR